MLKATLYPHQQKGLNWLKKQELNGYGGILADDMGLGKTIQMIALMCDNPVPHCNVIIVPKCVLDQWISEIYKHSSGLTVTKYHGTSKYIPTNYSSNHIIISTYGTIIKDLYKMPPISRMILDEAHYVKNAKAKRTQGVLSYAADYPSCFMWCLTGTPFINKCSELANLAKIVGIQPYNQKVWWGNMDSRIDSHIQDDEDSGIYSFTKDLMLRRRKEQVNINLPTKHYELIPCFMNTEQFLIYQMYVKDTLKFYNQYIRTVATGAPTSFGCVLATIVRLKQICVDPLMIKKRFSLDDIEINTPTTKIKEALHIIEQHPNDKIVIFSQWITSLEIISAYLDNIGIRYAMYHSKEKQLNTFKNNDNCKVLLCGLLSGGVGLNITEANVVIFMDLYWNKAVEDQGEGRVYRIGQTKPVYIYKLYTPLTIEDWILNMQNRKKGHSDCILDKKVNKNTPTKEQVNILFNKYLKNTFSMDNYDRIIAIYRNSMARNILNTYRKYKKDKKYAPPNGIGYIKCKEDYEDMVEIIM